VALLAEGHYQRDRRADSGAGRQSLQLVQADVSISISTGADVVLLSWFYG
jgi:hypothetical protein